MKIYLQDFVASFGYIGILALFVARDFGDVRVPIDNRTGKSRRLLM